jgi:hypothetical protein
VRLSTLNSLRRHRNAAPKPGATRPRARRLSPVSIQALNGCVSSSEVIRQAVNVIHHVIEAYAAPDKTFDELRQNIDAAVSHDPIKNFSVACRGELKALLS